MASCFKLSLCAGHHKHDFAASAGNEASVNLSDNKRWSFKQKSASQLVITHTVSANSSSGDMDSVDFVNQQIAPQEPTVMHLNNDETSLSVKLSAVTLIQTAVRRFLAQRELMKLKTLVKLQAAIRGHLVRQHAIRSLHCLQALAKIQALARARHVKSSDKSFMVEDSPQDAYNPVGQAKVDAADSTHKIDTSDCIVFHDKLLSSRFARQLLKSAQNPKHLNINCNPSSSCPVWFWMELWMSLASPINIKLSSFSVKNSPRTRSSQLVTKSSHTKNREVQKSKDSVSSQGMAYDSSAGNSELPRQQVDMRLNSLGADTSESDSESKSQPSYMKATVSTNARHFASNSPRLNHNVLEKEMSFTRRHSLPVPSLKQISPKLRQPSNKTGTHS